MTEHENPFNILILEDIRAVADRLKQKLEAWPKARVLPICATVAQGLSCVRNQNVDILIADLKLPDGIGISVIQELKELNPSAHIIVMTVLNDGPVVLNAIRAGATGYVLKDDTSFGLIAAIEMVLAGQSPMSATIARLIMTSLHCDPEPAVERDDFDEVPELTQRETDVLTAIAKGYSHKEVAEILKISHTTVPVHTRNIYRKLQASNKTQALATAKKYRLIPK